MSTTNVREGEILRWFEQNLWCLASTCNSAFIETYGDKIRVSHGFESCQMMGFIADIFNADLQRARLFAIRWKSMAKHMLDLFFIFWWSIFVCMLILI